MVHDRCAVTQEFPGAVVSSSRDALHVDLGAFGGLDRPVMGYQPAHLTIVGSNGTIVPTCKAPSESSGIERLQHALEIGGHKSEIESEVECFGKLITGGHCRCQQRLEVGLNWNSHLLPERELLLGNSP
jgi:hypothetical protein